MRLRRATPWLDGWETATMYAAIPFSSVVARWFDERRGLALGLTMSGLGLGSAAAPSLAEWLIDGVGFDALRSYTLPLSVCAGAMVAAALLFARLGEYPSLAPEPAGLGGEPAAPILEPAP